MFAVNGLVIGTYAAALPSLRDRHQMTDWQLPAVLFTLGVMGILSMQLGGRLADRVGARTVVLASLPLLGIGVLGLCLAPAYPLALVGAALTGLGNGAIDVAMNAYGVQVEQARRRPVMSTLHAMWSLGNFAGAGLVLATAGLATLPGLSSLAGAGALPLLGGLACAAALITLLVLARVAPAAAPLSHHDEQSGGRAKIPAAAWLLGLMAIAFGLGEGTAYDWSSIHVTDVAQVAPTTGALGLTTVAAAMFLIRLVGDRLVTRFGRRAVVRVGGVCAAVGYLLVAISSALPVLVVGWALVGLGMGMIAPQVYAVAGHMGGGRVLALVVTFGYATFLAGPAVVGGLVHLLGIQHAMFVPAALLMGLLLLAVVMPASDPDLEQ
ncbi:MFS transporter [Enemella dayhoffiae]|uniref:MFS transporter n=2 Tax=Enemella dayhoffiae TaxID=2016507 RepID=A0A255GQT3_9ACTN|nr:MFS transporter [Enemella dayhoffiae]